MNVSEYIRQIVMIEIGDTYDFKSITIFRVRIVEDKGRLRFRYSSHTVPSLQ